MNAPRHYQTRRATAKAALEVARGGQALRPRAPITRSARAMISSDTDCLELPLRQTVSQSVCGMRIRRVKVGLGAVVGGPAKKPPKKHKPVLCKCNKRCFCMPKIYSPVEIPAIWSEFRQNRQLCDGIIRCEDGVDLPIHRVILSAVSPYFKALFTNSINRNQAEEREATMRASSHIFLEIMDYAYTGSCNITAENVERLLTVADQYECLGVVQLCCQFLLNQLRPTNCLGLLKFAKHYFCYELELRGQKYVHHHFVEVLRNGCEFEHLDIEEVIELLQNDELNVKNEEVVFEAVQKWVDFDSTERAFYLPELIKCVRIGTLSSSFISNMLNWQQIRDSPECESYIKPILDMLDRRKLDLDVVSNPLLRPRIPYDILFAIGGWSAGSPTNFIETYDTRADRWLLSRDADSVPRAYHGLCTLRGLIYLIGGFDGNEHFNTVRCFDPVSHEWRQCACMYYPRCYVSVAMHANKIYALGGYNGRMRMSSAERYDPEHNQWELISPMQMQRSDASAAALGDKIYIVGGFNGQEVMSSAEMYDVLTNQWSYIPAMLSARSGVSLVAFKNALYALGGFNGYTRLTTGEKFLPGQFPIPPSNTSNTIAVNVVPLQVAPPCVNPPTPPIASGAQSSWVHIAEMFSSRSNFATVILDELIFVIGGFNDRLLAGSTTINYVECYDAEADEWFDAAPMNLNRSALSACVLSGLPNARDYSLLGKSTQPQELPHTNEEEESPQIQRLADIAEGEVNIVQDGDQHQIGDQNVDM